MPRVVPVARDPFCARVPLSYLTAHVRTTELYSSTVQKERVAELEKRYNPEDISLVGHSQSGLIAEIVPSKAREIIALNKATRPQDFLFRRRK